MSDHPAMELRHIRYLIAAAEEENFGRAADRLNVTRSAVSQIVADLEHELGIVLFERQAQKIKLTVAGHAMLPRLIGMMAELDQTVALGKRVGQGKSGSLTIGYGSLSTHHPVFRTAIKRFHEQYPDVVLSLIEIPTSKQLKALQDRAIHAGFMHLETLQQPPGDRYRNFQAEEFAKLESYVIDINPMGVIVPKDHRIARKGRVELLDMANEPLVMAHNSQGSPTFGRFFWLCRNAGFEPQIIQEVSATVTQQDLVSVGLGIGITVVGGRHTYPADLRALRFDDVDDGVSFQFSWMRGWVEPALGRFVDTVRACNEG